MSGIRGKDTQPELVVRRALHAAGLRYRLHDTRLPGKPDLVFPRHQAVVFVHGCFWHAHHGCRYYKIPSTRPEFWQAKLAGNAARDARNVQRLLDAGWRVATVWECAIRARAPLEPLVEWIRAGETATYEVRSTDPKGS